MMSSDSYLALYTKYARIVTKYFDRKFKAAGSPIEATLYDLLKKIKENQSAKPPYVTLSTLAYRLEMDRTTLSRRIPLLEKLGYASLEKDKIDDRRQKVAMVTEKGMEFIEKYAELYKNINDSFRHDMRSLIRP